MQSTSTAWWRASRFDARKRAFYFRKQCCVKASLREQVRSYALRAEADREPQLLAAGRRSELVREKCSRPSGRSRP
ncbi:hypothetical protein CXB41_04665 [Pseudomonas syringae pv. syringae]|nr:hypothetical protein CXB41_04665 [Pseudomonas syringae pv. syringae]